MRRYFGIAALLALLLAAGLFAVLKLTNSKDTADGSRDVLLLNEIAHLAALGETPSEDTARGREYVILDANGGTIF